MAVIKQDLKIANQMEAQAIEKVLLNGDLSSLNATEKVVYIHKMCEALELNALTKPFQLIKFQGKEILYATKDCTEQLRKKHNVSLTLTDKKLMDDMYIVTARATLPNGRTDESTGVLALPDTMKGEMRANAIMKAETKAKRRVTLSICGLGMLDESELDTMKGARVVNIIDPPASNAPQAIEHQEPEDITQDMNDNALLQDPKVIEQIANIAQALTLGSLEVRYKKSLAMFNAHSEITDEFTKVYEKKKSELEGAQ